jgi:cytidyltransferase-like protein
MVKKIVLVTGGFDPLHSGHIAYFNAARELGDKLVVGLNSDAWLERKKGNAFMPWDERATIVAALSVVDRVIAFNDDDNSSKGAIHKAREIFPNHDIIFANGGDRTKDNIPEMDVKVSNVKFVFGVGGNNKKNSSSRILEEWREPKTERPWGHWSVLKDIGTVKVKELVIKPGYSLSNQKHTLRNEQWFIVSGTISLFKENKMKYGIETFVKNDTILIDKGTWHKATNIGEEDCRIIEIQYGDKCIEEDIERK